MPVAPQVEPPVRETEVSSLDGFESDILGTLTAIPRDQSIHDTLRAFAVLGIEKKIPFDELCRIFRESPRVTERFAEDLGQVMESPLKKREEASLLPSGKLSKSMILHVVKSIVRYFLENLESGSLFSHLQSLDESCPPESKDELHSLLISERFQAIVVATFGEFATVILDTIFEKEMKDPAKRKAYFGYFVGELLKKPADDAETEKAWAAFLGDAMRHGVKVGEVFTMVSEQLQPATIQAKVRGEIVGDTGEAAPQDNRLGQTRLMLRRCYEELSTRQFQPSRRPVEGVLDSQPEQPFYADRLPPPFSILYTYGNKLPDGIQRARTAEVLQGIDTYTDAFYGKVSGTEMNKAFYWSPHQESSRIARHVRSARRPAISATEVLSS